jgi:hypothetical protein
MTFDELVAAAAQILATKGYQRLSSDKWCWESKRNRVCFAQLEGSAPQFPYSILRQRYGTNRDGDRVLHAETQVQPFGPDETPERIADGIERALTDPF